MGTMKTFLTTMLLLIILLPGGQWDDRQLYCWKGAATIDAAGYTEVTYNCIYI